MRKQLIFILLLFFVISCKKDNQNKNVAATVLYTGEQAADGCGWLIRIDNSANNAANLNYSPVNLTDEFKIDKATVIISYKILNTKFSCGNYPNSGITQIRINSIQKR